ncbi:MAG: thiamine phosphate synthase [Methanobrevibacter sp.]|uniref:thiamine phosphate synthase n=1 Tax=Methanobrevibacter sp. TaxID=66852 RepID=UPI001B5FFDC1|nr:thiamine phosphate synthase [Methanobrevibacter sp.]MBP3791446.1 thiamine phosphate synthase [Methanobrevibacter sp.]
MKDLDLSLYLVTDKSDDVEKFLKTIEEGIKGGVTVVQIREKTAETLDFYNLALKVKEITTKYNVPLIINDRVDVALAIDADGVHVGQTDMPCDVTRRLIGEDKILGVSASTIEEAQKAENDGADYIGTGAVFPTATKDDAPKITKKDLKDVVDSISIPVVAIGGITIDNAHELNNTGIAGLSVVSAIMSAENPKKASEELLNLFNS